MTANFTKLLLRSRGRIFAPVICNCRRFDQSKFCFSSKVENKLAEAEPEKSDLKLSIDQKFKVYRDEDAEVVFDVTEEIQRIAIKELEEDKEYRDPYIGLNMTRGKTGVFEIEDLVEFLKRDNAKNIFVARVPKEWAYVDYMVVVTANSVRHMKALMQFIRKAYKEKRHPSDPIPVAEGKTSVHWQAIDLGNIALHIFTQEARAKFDLETLWSVGSKYDDLTNEKQDMNIVDSYNAFLQEFEPADS